MDSFRIIGGKKLKGEIIPQGAKNEALQIISATLLTSDKITINNIPDIKDVMMLIELLKELGVKIEKNSKNSFSFSSTKINLSYWVINFLDLIFDFLLNFRCYMFDI